MRTVALAAGSFGHGSPEQVLEQLSRVDSLRALPAEEVQALVPYVERIEVPRGARVITQGESGDALYIVEDGIARVTLDDTIELGAKGPGTIFGEIALFGDERRTATVTAETDMVLWRVTREDLEHVGASSSKLRASLQELARRHREGQEIARGAIGDRRSWRARALRAIAARRRGLTGWQLVMAVGFLIVAALHLAPPGLVDGEQSKLIVAGLELLAGLTILQGACEAFVLAVERIGARLRWDGFISGTVGEAVATLPEFVVIAFLVTVEPLAAFVTAVVTIFNNALAFSVYSFFLPKDQKGQFLMPRALAKAGGEVLIVGSGVALIVGFLMLALRGGTGGIEAFVGMDLLLIGLVMLVIYAYYMYTLVRYYAEAHTDAEGEVPPDPDELGHATSWRSIGLMFGLGLAGAYFGGEAIGGFADVALHGLGLPTIPTAAFLAFFAGISEYIIVWKAHRRGELGIALSTVFGGMTQVMFLLLPFAMIVIGVLGLVSGNALYAIPINLDTTLLMLLLFPLFYVLLEFIKEDHTLNNLDAAAMTGIYALMLYFLFTAKT